MNIIDFLKEIDNLTPIERVNKIVPLSMKKQFNEVVRIFNFIDIELHALCPSKLIYLYDDEVFYSVIREEMRITYEEYSVIINFLDICKLIYRFNCALKFEIDDKNKKQFRINSWGREYVKTIAKKQNFDAVSKMIDDFADDYKKIINYLNGKLDTKEIAEIKKINTKLPIKLLS